MKRALLLAVLVAACRTTPVPLPAPRALVGEVNGLWWDVSSQRLLAASATAVLDVTGEPSVVAALPDSARGNEPGQLVGLPDGTLWLARHGGELLEVKGKEVRVVGALPEGEHLIGLSVDPREGALGAGFIKRADGPHGRVVRFGEGGVVSEVASGLRKVVGVLVVGERLFVTDQTAGVVLQAPLDIPAQLTEVAKVPGADLLAAAPGGALAVASRDGRVFEVRPDGTTREVASGLAPVRGLAVLPDGRLVVVERRGENDCVLRWLQWR